MARAEMNAVGGANTQKIAKTEIPPSAQISDEGYFLGRTGCCQGSSSDSVTIQCLRDNKSHTFVCDKCGRNVTVIRYPPPKKVKGEDLGSCLTTKLGTFV